MVPTLANSPSWRGIRRTRSSSPTRTGSVTSMVGKTTVSSSGTSRSEVMACSASLFFATYLWEAAQTSSEQVTSQGEDLSLGDSTRRHTQSTVQADHLAVQHGVLDDVRRERGELLGAPQARREGDAAAERRLRLLGQAGHQRRVEQP